MSLLHPSRRRIRAWFESGETDEGLEEHLDHCVRCADFLEGVAEGGSTSEEVDSFEPVLAQLLAAPDDLGQRMEDRISAAFQARQDLTLFAQMFGIAPQTTRLLLEPPDPPSREGS